MFVTHLLWLKYFWNENSIVKFTKTQQVFRIHFISPTYAKIIYHNFFLCINFCIYRKPKKHNWFKSIIHHHLPYLFQNNCLSFLFQNKSIVLSFGTVKNVIIRYFSKCFLNPKNLRDNIISCFKINSLEIVLQPKMSI